MCIRDSSKTNKEPAIKFQGINSGVGLNYSLGVDAIDGNNNKFHINRIDDADGFKQNLLTIKSDGNVGIGTAGPSAKLNIQNGHILVEQSVNTTQENILLQGSGYKLSNGTMYGNVSIRSNYDASSNAATLNFYTAASSTSTTERMRIKSDGSCLL